MLQQVDEAGIPVVFVTGRPLRWMEPFWPHIGQHGLAVVSNGAITYDVMHLEALPLTLAVSGFLGGSDLALQLGLIWLAHIGMDRAVGYGLKYATSFNESHLGAVGRRSA